MNSEKMDQLYRDFAPRVTNWLIANGTPYALACDLVQETFLRIWKKRDELIDDASMLSGLIFSTARHLRIDAYRKGRFLVYEEAITDDQLEGEDDAVTKADQRTYLHERIDEALKTLPPLLREAYTLFQISELSVHEIARITNASESLVKVRIFRAKEKLREALSDLKNM